MDNEFRISRLIRIYEKSGDWSEQSRRFEDWPSEVRTKIAEDAGMNESEHPILAFVSDESWTLLTLESLYWKKEGEAIQNLPVVDLAEITITDENSAKFSATVKKTMDELKIRTTQNCSFEVPYEAGSPLFGFWNTVQMMIRQNESTVTNQ